MQRRHQQRFESQLNADTSLRNYEYLDLLDKAWEGAGIARPTGGILCDVGCASFWYAAALQAFFEPASLLGVEVEGYRLYRDGHTRRDYATGYLAQLPQARFLIADYAALECPADLITAWFPFLTPASILAWRLPLSLLRPEALIRRVGSNLRAGGQYIMVNHGQAEAAIAARICLEAGLNCLFTQCPASPLSRYRGAPPILSCWQRAQPSPSGCRRP